MQKVMTGAARTVRGTRPSLAGLAALALALVLAGCGGGTAATGRPELTVSAAASLTDAFTQYAGRFRPAKARFSFAGSDELAAQIQQGVKPDVFAAANTTLPDALHAKGLVAKPVVFAANRLVIAVPAGSTRVRSVADLAKPGVKIAIGAASVPIGAYTRKVLANLPAGERSAIMRNVGSEEPDVKGIVAKVTEQAVDAGLVYVTDVKATRGRAGAVALPARLQPQVSYAAAVVKGTKHPVEARKFIDGLVHGAGRRDLRAAGFLPPP